MAKFRLSLIAVAAAGTLVLTGCSSSTDSSDSAASESASSATATASTITVEDNYGSVEINLPVQRTAATDNRIFEVLQEWDIPLVAAPKTLIPSTLGDYGQDESVADLGSHREPNLEALVAAEPDLIISGQRFSQYYEDMKELVPDAAIVDFNVRDDQPFFDELKREVTALGEIYNKQGEATQMIEDFDKALERARAAYNGNDTVMALNVTGGEINYIAPSVGRTFGPIFDLLELKPSLTVDDASSNHMGDDISVEAIAQSDPQWIFVLDRDGGTSAAESDEYQSAEKVIADNQVIANVAAVRDNHVVIAPKDTYTNESLITYTEILNQIADAFEAAN